MVTHGQQIDGGLWVVPNDDRGAFPIGGSLPEHVTLTLLCIRMCSLLATELVYRRAACKDIEVRKTMMAAPVNFSRLVRRHYLKVLSSFFSTTGTSVATGAKGENFQPGNDSVAFAIPTLVSAGTRTGP